MDFKHNSNDDLISDINDELELTSTYVAGLLSKNTLNEVDLLIVKNSIQILNKNLDSIKNSNKYSKDINIVKSHIHFLLSILYSILN